jgi:MCP family monocarboxylic acid transporter-like MFS transporter 13/MCP family monocarboxylic acid transporter-like MFS transporter 12
MNASTVIMFYYNKQRVLAQAIGISGLAAGGIVLPICIQYLNEQYAWKGGLIILAAIALNVCVCGALVRPIKTTNGRSDNPDRRPGDKTRGIRHTLKKLLCSRTFIFLCIQNTSIFVSVSILSIHMKAIALDKTGVSDELGSYVVSFYGAALFFGLLFCGFAAHVIKIEPIILLEMHYFCCACAISLIPVCQNVVSIVFLCVFAYFTGANLTILPLVLYTLVGEDTIRIAWAIRFVFCGIGGLAGPAMAGILHDYTKDYDYSMYLCGAGIFLSVLLMIEPCVNVMRAKRRAKLNKMDTMKN